MAFQEQFHMPEGTYLLSHSVGLMSKHALQSLEAAYLEPWRTKGGDAWPQWLSMIDDFRVELGNLLGGQAFSFCPQSNLSSALVKYMLSLPDHDQRRTVLMHPDAFPSMGFAIAALDASGISLEFLPAGSDPRDAVIWDAALKPHHDVALITHAHSNTGALSPVKTILDICRTKGVRSIVDIAQSAGIVPIDLTDWSADMVMGSCVKWLCGGPGAGFMWVNPDKISELAPRDVGWFSHENPFEFDITSFRYAGDAMRFWGGTPTVAPYALALGSLRTLSVIGMETIWQHNRMLLAEAIRTLPSAATRDFDLETNGGTLCLNVSMQHLTQILETLKAEGVQVDSRGSTIRASFHVFNTLDDVNVLSRVASAVSR